MNEEILEPYSDLYIEGIRLFNEEEFFECHDVLEEYWAGVTSGTATFYQGLIQAAVALFHFGNENFGGARKMYLTSSKYLEKYTPYFEGICVEQFLIDMKHCFQELLDAKDVYPTDIELQDERVPKIQFPVFPE